MQNKIGKNKPGYFGTVIYSIAKVSSLFTLFMYDQQMIHKNSI